MPMLYEVREFNGEYSVSKCGKVYSNKTNKFLKQNPDMRGYMQVCLYHKGKTISRKVHKLVGDRFIDKKANNVYNHIDGDKRNNCLSNLEEVTHLENISHKQVVIDGRGCVGVTFLKRVGKWQSRITVNGKRKSLGNFLQKEDAIKAYKDAVKKYGLRNKYV